MAPSGVTATVIGWVWLGISLAAVLGRSIGTPAVIIGAATMKMISSTSITSTMGVTLISLITALPLRRRRRPPPPSAPPVLAPMAMLTAPRFELAAQNGGEFIREPLQPPGHLGRVGAELVVENHRRNGRDQPDGSSEQRLGDR